MTDWQSRYPTLLATPAEAIAAVRRGRRILIGSGAAEPTTLVRALIDHGDQRPNRGIYPVAEESEIEVDGITLAVRPVRASDEVTSSDSPMALPTSRMAMRGR